MKKLFLLTVISLVGAGIAWGASTVLFAPSSDDSSEIEPLGLIDEVEPLDTAAPSPTATPSPSPEASAAIAPAGAGPSSPAATDVPRDDNGVRIPRSSGETGTTSKTVSQGVNAQPSTGECDDENNDTDREDCEDELEAEADEEEAEREADQDRDEERADRQNDRATP